MKKTMKRVLTFMLVLCMLATEFPASVFATGSASADSSTSTDVTQNTTTTTDTDAPSEGVKIVYNFSNGFSDGQTLTNITMADTNNFWSHAVSTINGTSNLAKNQAGCAKLGFAVGGISAYQIYVPADGEYDFSITRGTYKAGGEGEVYIVRDAATCEGTPSSSSYKHTGFSNTLIKSKIDAAVDYNSEEAATADAVKFGILNCDTTSTGNAISGFESIPYGKIKLTKGYHLVVLKGKDKLGQSNVSLYFRNFTLSAGNGSALMHNDVTVDKSVIMPGGKAQITAKAYLSNPDVSGATFRYYSSNTAVATVDDNGLVTGVAEGEVKITVSILHNGVVLEAHDVAITVRNPVLTGSVFKYDFNAHLTEGASVRDITAFTATHNFWAYAGDTATGAVTVDDNGIVANASGAGQYLALKLNVAANCNYNVSLLHSTKIDGALADVYILPGSTTDIAGALTDANKLSGAVSFYSTSTKTDAVTELGTKELTAGEYIVVFKATNTGASGWKMYPGMLTLSAGDAVTAMDFVVSSSATSLRKGKTATISYQAYLSDPEATEVTYAFKSLNKYATVDENGVVTIVAAETGTTTAMAQIEVTVYGYGQVAGTCVVNIEVIPFNAASVSLTYNYVKWQAYQAPVRDISYAETNGFWSYYADYAVNANNTSQRPIIIHTDYGIQSTIWNTQRWIAIKLYIPAEGDYLLRQGYRVTKEGSVSDVYILPGTTEKENISSLLTNDNKVGRIDFYGTPAQTLEADLGTVHLEKGEAILVVKTVAQGTGGNHYITLGTTKLIGGDGLAVMGVNASVPVDVLTVGNKTQVSAVAYLSDYTSDGISYRFESLTPGIAKIDATGVLTGVSEGIARIKVVATGPSDSNETIIEVPVGKGLSGSKYIYNFTKYQTDGNAISEVTDYALTHNFWKFATTDSSAAIKIDADFGIDAAEIGSGKYFAVKVNVTKAGKYYVQQTYYRAGDNGGKADVYILPGNTTDIAAKLATANKLGTVDFTGVGASANLLNLGAYNFSTAGDYIIVYKDSGTTTGTTMRLGNFALIGGQDLQIMDFGATVKKTDIKEFEIVKTVATVYMSDGTTTTNNVSYTSSNKNVVTVDDAGVITAVKKGTATVTAAAGKFKKTFTFTVAEFKGSGVKIDYEYDRYHDYKDEVRDITNPDETKGFWTYYADNKPGGGLIIHSYWGIRATSFGDTGWFALKISVPQKGEYLVTQDFYASGKNGAIVDVYVVPTSVGTPNETDKIQAALTADRKVGSLDTYGSQLNDSEQLGFWTFPEAGEYLLVFRANGKNANSKGGYMYIGSTHLYGGENVKPMSMAVTPGRNTLYQGDTTPITAKTYMSDGTVANIAYRYESLNDCAAVNRSGVVTAVKPGTAEIKVTAVTPDGQTMSKVLTLTITLAKPANTKLYYDFLTGFAYLRDARTITYKDTLNTWEYYADGGPDRNMTIHTKYGIWFKNSQKKHWAAFKINVTTPGDYMMSVRHAMYTGGCHVGVYILPGNTPKDQIENMFTSQYKVNEVYMGYNGFKVVTSKVGVWSFPEAGEYIVVYKPLRSSTEEGVKGWNMYMGSITLDGNNCLKTVESVDAHVNLNWGETHQTEFVLRDLLGATVDPKTCTITYRSADSMIASIDDNGLVKAVGHGTTTIHITAYDGVESHEGTYTVTCTDNSGVKNAYIDLGSQMYVRETALVNLVIVLNSGNEIRLDPVETFITVSDEKLMSLSNGTVTALTEGTVTIKASSEFLSQKVSAELAVTIVTHPGKTEATYYTMEMRNNAKQNVITYDWAQSTRDSTVKSAVYYLRAVDELYDNIMSEGLPRSRQIGYRGGEYRTCRYCGADVMGLYGANGVGGWNIDPVKYPWKIQCKDCLRLFPSNDFESFYKLGLDEHGNFDYDRAWEANEKLKATGHKGYLVNELYPEKGEDWGVDDGYGARVYKDGSKLYKFEMTDPNIDKDKSACYIPMYMYYFWNRMRNIVETLKDAYLYTNDITYARAGAVLLDRIADVLPAYNTRLYAKDNKNYDYTITCGGTTYGVLVGRIDDPLYFRIFALAADAFFPALNDSSIIRYLSREAQERKLENDKTTSQKIWQNWRDNILYLTYINNQKGLIKGNYGLGHYSVSAAAIVMAEEPETSKMLEWILACNPDYSGGGKRTAYDGGDFFGTMLTTIDRDGMGDEGAPGYNQGWVRTLMKVADDIALYGDSEYNLYNNPKFAQMFFAAGKMTLSDSHTAEIADCGDTAGLTFVTTSAQWLTAWTQYKDTPYASELARYIYVGMKGNVDLSYGIFSADPYAIRREIYAAVDEHFEKESYMMSGTGYTSLNSGRTGEKDSLRSVWMSYGITTNHGHYDSLNIGIESFGLNLAPDFGYPPNTTGDTTNSRWQRRTVAHNTVVVDESDQTRLEKAHDPYIFDDSDYVKVMGAEAKGVYRQTQIYKRTVVMIKVDGDNSYYLDFFRVKGGEQHTYSFHAQSQGAIALEGLEMQMQVDENGQPVGTYAGADVPFNSTGDFYTPYSFMTKVRKDTSPEKQFTVDFSITDYRGAISNNKNIHLKMTQLSNFTPDEVAIVGGLVPVRNDNSKITEETDTFEFVLTQRKSKNGEALDSLFTTVFEPYRGRSYITSIEEVPVKVVSGKPGADDMAKAVLITHTSGRMDYVFYASNNSITYRVADTFNVRGDVAVYSLNGATGTEIYRYVLGGNIIVEDTEDEGVFRGTVLDFSKDFVLQGNYIDVNLDPSVAPDLVGKVIHVENDGVENGAYNIVNAKPIEGGVRIDLGRVSLIRNLRDQWDLEGGYIYNIAKGQRFEIHNSYLQSDLSKRATLTHFEFIGDAKLTPAFDPDIVDYTSFVDESVQSLGLKVLASDPNATIKVKKGNEVQEGATIDEINIAKGKNKIYVTVTAEDGMTTKTYFITVYKSDHICYGGQATCQEKAICDACGRPYGEVDPNYHANVELWNGKYATETEDGYSGDYYCIDCNLLATRGHVLKFEASAGTNWLLILLIATGVLFVGAAATVTTVLVVRKKKKVKATPATEPEAAPEIDPEA